MQFKLSDKHSLPFTREAPHSGNWTALSPTCMYMHTLKHGESLWLNMYMYNNT